MEGECVALPTEASYELVASALHPGATERLRSLKAPEQTPAVVLFEHAQLLDWLPRLRGSGARLFRKLGPGPVGLRADAGCASGLLSRLPGPIRDMLVQAGRMTVRWPAHPIWGELGQAGLPLVSVPVEGGVNAEETAKHVGSVAACIVDAGATQFGGPVTIVKAVGRRCLVERLGVLLQEQIDELAVCRILFICTGNTCRSPMAERLCAKLLSDHLGCAPADLSQQGFCVQSAGMAAMMGGEASPDAVRVAAELGTDLASHRSRMATWEMFAWADHVFAMTAGQWYALRDIAAATMPPPSMLSPRHEDIADPIGGELADYRTCAHQILECLKERLPELLES